MLALALWALSAASMSDNITTAAAGKEVSKAVERERRNDRWAAAEQQPAATSSDSRAPSQKWRVRGFGHEADLHEQWLARSDAELLCARFMRCIQPSRFEIVRVLLDAIPHGWHGVWGAWRLHRYL